MSQFQYIIRKALPGDIDEIYRIEQDSSALWKRDFFVREFKTDFSCFLVAKYKKRIIGFAVAWLVSNEIQLNNIAVEREFRGIGIGEKLIEQIVEISAMRKPFKILIELKEKNISAYKFYIKLGFTKTGLRKDYYNDDNALLMEKTYSE